MTLCRVWLNTCREETLCCFTLDFELLHAGSVSCVVVEVPANMYCICHLVCANTVYIVPLVY